MIKYHVVLKAKNGFNREEDYVCVDGRLPEQWKIMQWDDLQIMIEDGMHPEPREKGRTIRVFNKKIEFYALGKNIVVYQEVGC